MHVVAYLSSQEMATEATLFSYSSPTPAVETVVPCVSGAVRLGGGCRKHLQFPAAVQEHPRGREIPRRIARNDAQRLQLAACRGQAAPCCSSSGKKANAYHSCQVQADPQTSAGLMLCVERLLSHRRRAGSGVRQFVVRAKLQGSPKAANELAEICKKAKYDTGFTVQ